MLLSGFAALSLEMVWLRRLSLQIGSAGLSATITLSIYMAGLGIGSIWSSQYPWKHSTKGYGLLEIFVAAWTLAFPFLVDIISPMFTHEQFVWIFLLCCPLLMPPAIAHGASLPALVSSLKDSKKISWLYATNTAGAVLGVLLSSFLIMPSTGVRGTELLAALCCGIAGVLALFINRPAQNNTQTKPNGRVPNIAIMAAFIAGGSSMALEIIWSRLGALLIGGSVYAFAVVLAVFLVGIAIGAERGRHLDKSHLPTALSSIGLLAVLGCFAWRWLPHGIATSWAWFGDGSLLPTGAVLLSIAMAGAPIASGMVFSLCLHHGEGKSSEITGQLLFVNTIGGVIGVLTTGVFLMPKLGIVNTTLIIAGVCILTGVLISKKSVLWRVSTCFLFTILCTLLPSWDVAVYATGLYNRIGEFVDFSPRAVERFAHEGWSLRYYKDGHSASVAVGQSDRTGNLWLSINGKVDASTGADMPTQILSGQLPLMMHPKKEQVKTMVIGLASGVTANEAHKNGAKPLSIIEMEPAIIEASHWFETVNDRIYEHPDVTVRIADARSILSLEDTLYDVIISEPSNPWITGVSNLFTVEYWKLGQKRLTQDGVFCQWLQLYALPPKAFRSLMASYLSVFPNTWLFETIPGSDALLISANDIPDDLPLKASLNPAQLKRIASGAKLNTDDQPWIEFEAPKWINRSTGTLNGQIIEDAKNEPILEQ
ncbi:MAG: hypothetical protein CMK59_09810 [Proteobacteria bacterium]|nr:hypothetical protein [Pseudomonadota bacterium]